MSETETIRHRFSCTEDVRNFYRDYYHDGLPVNERHIEQTCANYGLEYEPPEAESEGKQMAKRKIPIVEPQTEEEFRKELRCEPIKEAPAPQDACRVCGCTEENACLGGCCWLERGLCSSCAEYSCADPSGDCPAREAPGFAECCGCEHLRWTALVAQNGDEDLPDFPDPPFEHEHRPTFNCQDGSCFYSPHLTGLHLNDLWVCRADDKLPDADYSNDPDDPLCPLYKERSDTEKPAPGQWGDGGDQLAGDPPDMFCEPIQEAEQQWPESCEACPPAFRVESGIICSSECPHFHERFKAVRAQDHRARARLQEDPGLSIGELAHQSQVDALEDPDNGLTRAYGCTSTPYRTYGDEVCPSIPGVYASGGKKRNCKGCWAWKEITGPSSMQPARDSKKMTPAEATIWALDLQRKAEIAASELAPIQEAPIETVLDQFVNGPGPTWEEIAAEKERFKNNLDRRFAETKTPAGPGYIMADVNLCYPTPNNPRKRFDQESMDKLTESVKQVGILEPLLVVADDTGYLNIATGEVVDVRRYRIVCGERRWRAAIAAGLQLVPVIVRELTPDQEFECMLTENLQRQDLDPIEEATAFKAATARGWKQEQLAEKLDISQAQVANRLRLLKLPPEVQELISREILSAGHGLELVRIAAAPALVKKMAEEFAERHTPIRDAAGRIANEVSGAHDSYGRPLYTDGRIGDAPKFDYETVCLKPYESRKGACKYIVKAEPPCWETKNLDSHEERPYCIHPECWDKRQKEAIDVERETRMEQIRTALQESGAIAKDHNLPIKLPKVKDLERNDAEGFYHYSSIQPQDCPGCEKIIDALGYSDEIVKICTDKPCWDKKVRAKENAKVKESKQKNADFEATKDAVIQGVLDDICSREHLIYIALQSLRNPASSSKWTPTKVQTKAFKVFNLPCDSVYREKTQDVVGQLQLMNKNTLLKLIFFCALRGLDEYGRSAFDLTLGAAAGEEE